MSGRDHLVSALFGCEAATDEAFGDRTDLEYFEREERTLAQASRGRLAEFRTARSCAREALRALGLPASSIPVGADHAPVWPEGVIGSITHCHGYRAAVVAKRGQLLALGIDAEPDAPLPEGVAETMFSEEEVSALRGLQGGPNWERLLFSVKESVFKLQTQLRAHDPIQIVRVHEDGRIQTSSSGSEIRVDARWAVGRGLIVTSATARSERRRGSP